MLARKHPPPCPPVDNLRHILIIINMTLEQRCYVRAISQKRRAEWDRVFGVEELPVRSPRPTPTPGGCLAYRLDANRLHWMQRERLVRHLVRRERMTPMDARLLVVEGLPIPSADAALVQEFEQDVMERPAFRLWWSRFPALAQMC